MADPVEQADAKLKAADAAWSAARSKIYPTNGLKRKLDLAIREGGEKPGTEYNASYLRLKAEYDEAVIAEATAAQAYRAAQENYKVVYAQDNNATPVTPSATTTQPVVAAPTPVQSETVSDETQNPSPVEATAEASGPQASVFAPAIIDPNTDPNTNIGSAPVIENATPQFATGQNAAADAAFQEANASEQQVIDPNSDPNTNIGNDSQEPIPQPQQTISAASDINTNIGTEGQIAPQKTLPDSSPDGPPRDDNGNLMPGWNEDEFGTPYYVGNGFVAPETQASANATRQGITTNKANAQGDATAKDAASFEKAKDWRVRLSLAPSAKYLYKADNPGILQPLQATNGVIFPYTPTVSAVYAANYDASELVHSNYKIYNYKNSNVDTVTITGDFTAQDTTEANYLLAVIQFFKSVTKMFYGQDQNPRNGTPPPLVYMSGMGTFQFDNHPLAVTNFTYSLPNEVDYIRAGSTTNASGQNVSQQTFPVNTDNASTARIQSSGLGVRVPNFQRQQATINSNATYVPTKMQIAITCIPIVTRNDISNNFSLRDYATGKLLQGSKRNGGGIW
jgi:hypothetical protein